MIATIVILSALLIYSFSFIYSMSKKIEKQQYKIQQLKIPYDDYSRYQKAYIAYYKWLGKKMLCNIGTVENIYNDCQNNLVKYFEDEKN